MASLPKKLCVVVVGDGGVGKRWDPTIEDSYTTNRTIDGQEYSIELIDTAGQEEYRGLWGDQTVLLGDAFIFTYAINSKESLMNLSEFLHIVRKVKSPDDNPPLSNSPDNNPFVYAILGNKSDVAPNERQVSAAEGLHFARAGGGLFFETSAKHRVNIDSAFDSIVRAVVNSRSAEATHRKSNRREKPFNPNVGYVNSHPEEVLSEPKPSQKGKNKGLKMDRRQSMSIGGMNDEDGHKSRCCCIQ